MMTADRYKTGYEQYMPKCTTCTNPDMGRFDRDGFLSFVQAKLDLNMEDQSAKYVCEIIRRRINSRYVCNDSDAMELADLIPGMTFMDVAQFLSWNQLSEETQVAFVASKHPKFMWCEWNAEDAKRIFEQKCYNAYLLQWMIMHDVSLEYLASGHWDIRNLSEVRHSLKSDGQPYWETKEDWIEHGSFRDEAYMTKCLLPQMENSEIMLLFYKEYYACHKE